MYFHYSNNKYFKNNISRRRLCILWYCVFFVAVVGLYSVLCVIIIYIVVQSILVWPKLGCFMFFRVYASRTLLLSFFFYFILLLLLLWAKMVEKVEDNNALERCLYETSIDYECKATSRRI